MLDGFLSRQAGRGRAGKNLEEPGPRRSSQLLLQAPTCLGCRASPLHGLCLLVCERGGCLSRADGGGLAQPCERASHHGTICFKVVQRVKKCLGPGPSCSPAAVQGWGGGPGARAGSGPEDLKEAPPPVLPPSWPRDAHNSLGRNTVNKATGSLLFCTEQMPSGPPASCCPASSRSAGRCSAHRQAGAVPSRGSPSPSPQHTVGAHGKAFRLNPGTWPGTGH